MGGAGVPSGSAPSACSVGSAGSRMMKAVPSPTLLCTLMVPPWFFTMRWQMASPSPVPFCFVVKKGTKMCGC
ncbi:hypothetical protein COSO111634_27720 [Corallococcus soli]